MLPYISGFYVLRFSNGEEIYYYLRFDSQVESEIQTGITAIMDAYRPLTKAVVSGYGLKYQIHKDGSFPMDTVDSKKAIIMVRLSDGELYPLEVEAIDENIINADNTINLNDAGLIAYIDMRAQLSKFDGRTIDQTDGINGMVSGFAV